MDLIEPSYDTSWVETYEAVTASLESLVEAALETRPCANKRRQRLAEVVEDGIGVLLWYTARVIHVFHAWHQKGNLSGTIQGTNRLMQVVEKHQRQMVAIGVPLG